MLLGVDVGNTNITFGIFKKDELVLTFRMMTKQQRTSDEFAISIMGLMEANGISKDEIDGAIITSVVPNVMHSLTNAITKYIGVNPIIVGPGVKTGIKIATSNPREIGADRIIDAVGAYEKYGGPVLVIDFGTATTYDVVSEDGSFIAGITAPGIKISAAALWEGTAKLPEIEIKKPRTILAQDTITSMQAGLVYGQIGQTEYIISKVKEETGFKNLKVVATGGLGGIICPETKMVDVYDRNLTFDGLRIVYEKNCDR